MPAELTVLRATGAYVVVDKPPGMLSVPGKGEAKADCVAARVKGAFPDASGPLIVHRLDMDTSGLMVLGLTPGAQRALSAQFEARTVEKRYTALVEGLVAGESGVVDVPIRADIERRPFQVVDRARGRPSVTHWRVLAHEIDRTRVEFRPVTGRSHQIRVHAALARGEGGLGHAILGDVLYATDGAAPGGAWHAERLMLHASRLEFDDPETGRRVAVESPAPF